ncbi:hypothetical protein KS4_11970 [Poriferisphaera corsica]|uniref:Uncharacterized protein n=1 Tax=Poriferisphaera corsica TaxID=2528020 RepID=A0A517YSM8_9BACT|nr:hypothetical protein KS4_11970 [Poriferisphaera corsica]
MLVGFCELINHDAVKDKCENGEEGNAAKFIEMKSGVMIVGITVALDEILVLAVIYTP